MSKVDRNHETMMLEAFLGNIRRFCGYHVMFDACFTVRLEIDHQSCTRKAYTIIPTQLQSTMLFDLLGLKDIMH